ncbi:Hypothetical protein PHPALM_13085, partial [Phytophthora palmivora]
YSSLPCSYRSSRPSSSASCSTTRSRLVSKCPNSLQTRLHRRRARSSRSSEWPRRRSEMT